VVQLGDIIVDFGSVIDKSIATASAESEYRAASLDVREVKYFRNLLNELRWPVDRPSPMYMDNEAARLLVADDEKQLPKFAKHVALAYHNVRHETSVGTVAPAHRKSSELIADILTKSFLCPAFQHLKRMIPGLGDSSVVKERVSGQVTLKGQALGGGPIQLPSEAVSIKDIFT